MKYLGRATYFARCPVCDARVTVSILVREKDTVVEYVLPECELGLIHFDAIYNQETAINNIAEVQHSLDFINS